MATSGSVDFGHTRTQAIEAALRKCGVLREGVSASSNQLSTGSIALNGLLKELMVDGMPLWAIKEIAIFPIHDISYVDLGPSGGHAATTWVHTQTSAAAAAAATTITVDSITGISASDNIGVELDSGNIFWTTVSGAPSGSTITLATGLTTAAAVDSHVYTYTNKTVRPLKIIQAARFDYTNSDQQPLNIVSRDEFQRLSATTTEGEPNQIYYDPQLTNGRVRFYPRFSNGNSIIKVWGQRPFEDMDEATNTFDFPQEWELAIVFGLAAILAPEMGVPDRKMITLTQLAASYRMKAGEFGQEEGSVYFTAGR